MNKKEEINRRLQMALARTSDTSSGLNLFLRKKNTPKKGVYFLAQRRGFEPPDQFSQSHDFQSCSLNHSDISAYSALSSSAYLYYCIF